MKNPNSVRRKVQLKKILWITVVWTIISLYQFLLSYNAVNEFNCDLKGNAPSVYFYGSLLTGIFAGLIGGSSLVFTWERWLRSKTYGAALWNIFISFCGVYIIVAVFSSFYMKSNELNASIFDIEVAKSALGDIFEVDQIQSFITWLVIVLLTLVALQINDKYGPGVFGSFLMGKYFQPTREERIFMFLDLRSSTTIAEKLGEVRYFQFIRNVFRDVTPAIIYAEGEIYQYVGDEIVISWRMDKGLKNSNCLQCFFEVQTALLEKRNEYLENFDGIEPVFKAGIHYGHVMAGEVGVVKRDIAYSGDVLNTTARIQSKCNELGVDILLSKYLLDKLKPMSNKFNPKRLGEILLRGKSQEVILYTV